MDAIISGIIAAISLGNLLAVAGGVIIGIGIGAIPGLAPPLAISVAIPLTFTMSPLPALGMLVGVMKGSGFGGAISAILLNTPGTPAATATTFDGHPLARQGKPRRALKMALYSSVFGDTCSDLVLILVAAPIAVIALKAGPLEISALLIISMTVIAAMAGDSMIKALIATAFGVLLTTVGIDPETATPRLTFGVLELWDGLSIGAMAIGILALSEVFIQIENSRGKAEKKVLIKESTDSDAHRVNFREFWSCKKSLARAAAIGTTFGALPGLGTSLAAFISYAIARQKAEKPEEFGTGKLEGIAATEAANSAVVGANLIPLLTLGIPGNIAAALLMGAFIIHGLQPGPLLFKENPDIVYGLFAAMLMANAMNFSIGNLGLRLFVLLIKIPGQIIYPIIVLLCMMGLYISSGSLFVVGLMVVFGMLGYFMRKLDFSFVCFAIGFVLGPMIELHFRQSFLLFADSPQEILGHPFALFIVALTPFALWYLAPRKRKSREPNREGSSIK